MRIRHVAPSALRAFGTRAALACCLGSLAALSACSGDTEARLVPVWGCALEGEPLTSLRVRARGDLSAADADQLLLAEGSAVFDDLPDGVEAMTVEGLFGESTVLAVGRTTRLERDGELPVYFAPPDQLCPVESSLVPRDRAAVAVNDFGDVVAVGGQGVGDTLLDEVVVIPAGGIEVVVGAEGLDTASVGQTLVAAGGRREFVAVGGAAIDHVLGEVYRVEIDAMGEPSIDGPFGIEGVDDGARAYHGAGTLPDGRVLVAGGCTQIDFGACRPADGTVLRSAYWVDPGPDTPEFSPAPAMLDARFDFAMHVSRDGVVFAVGGRDAQNAGIRDVEMLLPDAPGWAPYGPALFEALGELDIVGSTLLEGGLIVFALSDGSMWRVDQNHLERFEAWCDEPEDACFLSPVDTFRRSLLGLWGERVLADRFVLPVGILGQTGASAVDLSAQKPGQTFRPPGPRAGAGMVSLADGTVVSIGGRVPASGLLATPVVTRFRPVLDGPDEGTPDISTPDGGAVILHDRMSDPARISAATQTLVLEPDPIRATDFAVTWVHFRGFRSRRFALEGRVEALNGSPELRFVFSRGAIARTELVVGADGLRLAVRDADGSAVAVDCDDRGVDFSGVGRTVRVQVSPGSISVFADEADVGMCPWAGEEAVAVGLGAVGAGTIRATGLRLSRG